MFTLGPHRISASEMLSAVEQVVHETGEDYQYDGMEHYAENGEALSITARVLALFGRTIIEDNDKSSMWLYLNGRFPLPLSKPAIHVLAQADRAGMFGTYFGEGPTYGHGLDAARKTAKYWNHLMLLGEQSD